MLGAAAASGCAGTTADERVFTKQEVVAAFADAGLPVREFVEGIIPCDKRFDPPPRPVDKGVKILGRDCATLLVGEEPPPGVSLLLSRDHRFSFSVSIFPSSEEAEDLVASSPPKNPILNLEQTLLRDRNVVVGMWSASGDDLAVRIEAVLDDL